jgi:hypothetical protein
MAMTYTETLLTLAGDRQVGLATITHDGSSTTIALPTGQIDMAYLLSTCGTNSTGTTVSWSGGTLTFSAATASGRTDLVFWIGIS